jgi:hypothetical protein
MKFESKAHMAQALLDGKRFVTDLGVEIYYDESFTNPFRYGGDGILAAWGAYERDIWTEVKPRHVHQDLIDSYQDGQVWQYRHNTNAKWLDLSNHLTSWQPDWDEDTQYRLHPHNDLIQAHKNGAKIQAKKSGDWVEEPNPDWHEGTEYRIKPATKTVYEWMYHDQGIDNWVTSIYLMNEFTAEIFFADTLYQKTGRSWEVGI